MRWTILLAVLAVGPAWAQAGKTVDCYCTDSSGGRVEMGERTCLSVGGRQFMATCEMSLNVPIWRDTGESCLTG